jgi:hypothetical protein
VQNKCFANYTPHLWSGNCPIRTFELKNEKCVLIDYTHSYSGILLS